VPPGGSFEPTVLTDVTTDMVITKEETQPRRPALPLQDRRRGGQDANTGARSRLLFLQPRDRPHLARREALEYGIVGINEGIISTRSPFGGMKEAASAPSGG
jgi:succinate-semialdehyde dehydrogenase/glutarate-semialdehyde dehydrogenase